MAFGNTHTRTARVLRHMFVFQVSLIIAKSYSAITRPIFCLFATLKIN